MGSLDDLSLQKHLVREWRLAIVGGDIVAGVGAVLVISNMPHTVSAVSTHLLTFLVVCGVFHIFFMSIASDSQLFSWLSLPSNMFSFLFIVIYSLLTFK